MVEMDLRGYGISTTPDAIVISREGLGRLEFSPGHTPALRSLLGIATRLEGASAFPSPLRGSPFEIHFRVHEGDVEIEVRRESTDAGICLSFGEFDQFITIVDEAFDVFQNEAKNSPQRPRVPRQDTTGPGDSLV
jgi:hypothetical protein